jgi:hypothetical protein
MHRWSAFESQWDDEAVHRGGFARKSGAASRREDTARAAFTKAAADVEIQPGKRTCYWVNVLIS